MRRSTRKSGGLRSYAGRAAALLLTVLILCCMTACVEAPGEAFEERSVRTIAQTPVSTPEPMIALTDSQLLICVRRTLHESSRVAFTAKELSLILVAELEGETVQKLDELTLLPALETLHLTDVAVRDFSPLAKIDTLSVLTVEFDDERPAEVLSGLSQLTKLRGLTLINCRPESNDDFLSLRGLESLTLVNGVSAGDIAKLRSLLPDTTISTKLAEP